MRLGGKSHSIDVILPIVVKLRAGNDFGLARLVTSPRSSAILVPLAISAFEKGLNVRLTNRRRPKYGMEPAGRSPNQPCLLLLFQPEYQPIQSWPCLILEQKD